MGIDEVFCANGSNEVLQCLLLAYGGPGRTAALFEPTYTLHRHIARITGTTVAAGARRDDFALDLDVVAEVVAASDPVLTFLCSPNNPTGRADALEDVAAIAGLVPGLLVVDEAYGQFAPSTALALRAGRPGGPPQRGGGPDVLQDLVDGRRPAGLPGGRPRGGRRLRAGRPARTTSTRPSRRPVGWPCATSTRWSAGWRPSPRSAAGSPPPSPTCRVETWPSDANFLLFRPTEQAGAPRCGPSSWTASVLVRDCSSWPGLTGCLRVTVGLPEENDRFLAALTESLR